MRSGSVAAAILAVVISTQLIVDSTLAAAAPSPDRSNPSLDFIRISCKSTIYPKRCYRTLSPYASEIGSDPKKLAMKALGLSLKVTKSASKLMKRMARIPGAPAAALADCVEVVEDAVDELGKSIGELGGAPGKGSEFCRVIGDVETWVSAAETDDDTCLDGFEEVAGDSPVKRNVKKIVEKHVGRIGRFTSNALALVNLYASSRHVKC